MTPAERAALHQANPPITDPHLMAFLAWRRSVLFLVALALVPLTALRFYDAFRDSYPGALKIIVVIPAAAEALLCVVCWRALNHWMHWRQQRRTLFRAWLVFMAAPFAVFLIPMDNILQEIAQGDGQQVLALKFAIAVLALMTLAPKAVSLLAGVVRAGIVTKMLFPGTAGPGWLIVLASPIYALFVFTLLIIPYQVTDSGWYVGAMLALATGQYVLGRAGYALTKPTDHDDAVQRVGRARTAYLIAMSAFGLCLFAAFHRLASSIGVTTIINTVLTFETNVLILTLIGSDLVITNLERARGDSTGTAHHVEESGKRLRAFVSEG
ncbi:MAG: hypothetical protein ACTHU0_22610 [Kofleriaceae bacterium]